MHNVSPSQSDRPVEGASPSPSTTPEASPLATWAQLRPPALLTLWLVLTLTALVFLGWNVWTLYASFTKTTSEVMRFQELNSTAMQLNEALTKIGRAHV